jgi:hypothetical protein
MTPKIFLTLKYPSFRVAESVLAIILDMFDQELDEDSDQLPELLSVS